MTVQSKEQAWNEANKIIPNDYTEDAEASARAGYPIYRSNVEYYDYICDLGSCLEVNLKAGNKTVRINIEEQPKFPAKEIKEAAKHQDTFKPEWVQLVRVFVEGYKWTNEAHKAVYRAMEDERIRSQVAGDMVEAYCEDKGISWGRIQVISTTKYAGHYVIEAIVAPRVKQ